MSFRGNERVLLLAPVYGRQARHVVERVCSSIALTRWPALMAYLAREFGGCVFLAGYGSQESAVARGAIARVGRKPGVPRVRDALRGSPPLHKRLGL